MLVYIKALLENKDSVLYRPVRNSIEAFGFPYTANHHKEYLLGQLFVADAFIAWSNAKACTFEQDNAGWWRWRFHLLSFLLVVPFCWWVFKL